MKKKKNKFFFYEDENIRFYFLGLDTFLVFFLYFGVHIGPLLVPHYTFRPSKTNDVNCSVCDM